MTTRSRLAIAATVIALLAICGVAWFAYVATRRPAMPDSWQHLQRGMTHEDLVARVTGRNIDMRELKGFDMFSVESSMAGVTCWWQLQVSYDDSGKLITADARFIHQASGLLNIGSFSLLPPLPPGERR